MIEKIKFYIYHINLHAMLLSFLLSILFYVVPIPLIAYMVFLWVKIPAPRPPRLSKKIITITILALIIAHISFVISMTRMTFERDQRRARNGAYVNLALKDTIKLVDDSLFINYNRDDSLKRVAVTYGFPEDIIPLFMKDDAWKQMSAGFAHFFKKVPVNPDVSGEISLHTANTKQPDSHYRFKLAGDTIHMNAGRDTTQLLKYIKLSSTTHGQPATTK